MLLTTALQRLNQPDCRFTASFLSNRPTNFVSDEHLLSQLSPPEEWQHLGRGSYGSVFKAQWFGSTVAVKSGLETEVQIVSTTSNSNSSSISTESGSMEAHLFEEAVFHSALRHPHIVTSFIASPTYLVMEYMAGGTLEEYIRTHSEPSKVDRASWCAQLMSAVQYMHSFGVVHSDLSLANILVSESGTTIKVSDLGAAYLMNQKAEVTLTPQYLPLECFATPEADLCPLVCDRYAAAVLCACILEWKACPFRACGIPDFFERRVMECGDDKSAKQVVVKSAQTQVQEHTCRVFTAAASTLSHSQKAELCSMIQCLTKT